MVNVKEAVRTATAFVGELFPKAWDIRLEEVEPSSAQWTVVLSFKTAEPGTLGYVVGTEQRLFKAVAVNQEDGEPLSLKVWKQ